MKRVAVAFNGGGVVAGGRADGPVPLAGGEGGLLGGAVVEAGVLGGGVSKVIFSFFISTERKGCSRLVIGWEKVVGGVLTYVFDEIVL